MISFSIQEQREGQFAYHLGKLRDLARRGLVDPGLGTLSVQGRLLLEKCIQLTPFKSLSEAKKAITRDTDRIFRPLTPEQFTDPRIANVVRVGSAAAWDAIASRMRGPLGGTRAIVPTRALHKQSLDSRGRPRRTNFVTLRKQAPGLASVRKIAVEKTGWARAGWLHGYLELRGIRAPDWVKRHYPMAPGDFEDGRFDQAMPYIAARNSTKFFTQRRDSRSIMTAALGARRSAMKAFFEAQMRLASEGRPTSFQAQQQALAAQFDQAP